MNKSKKKISGGGITEGLVLMSIFSTLNIALNIFIIYEVFRPKNTVCELNKLEMSLIYEGNIIDDLIKKAIKLMKEKNEEIGNSINEINKNYSEIKTLMETLLNINNLEAQDTEKQTEYNKLAEIDWAYLTDSELDNKIQNLTENQDKIIARITELSSDIKNNDRKISELKINLTADKRCSHKHKHKHTHKHKHKHKHKHTHKHTHKYDIQILIILLMDLKGEIKHGYSLI